VSFAPATIDLRLDIAHLLVGNDQEIAGTACWVKYADARHTLAQVKQLGLVVARCLQLSTQIIQK